MPAEALTLSGWAVACGCAAAGLFWLDARRRSVNRAIHELRRPLQQVLFSLPAAETRTRAAEGAVNRSLAALDALDASVNRLRLPESRSRVDPESLLRECLDYDARRLRGVGFSWEAGPCEVKADPARLRQLFENLLDNAGEHGCSPFRISATRRGDWLEVVIRNELVKDVEGPRLAGPAYSRGHGLRIARTRASEVGGRLDSTPSEGGWCAVVELPLAGEPRAT